MRRTPFPILIPLQAVVAVLAVLGLALWPPAKGAILLIPMLQNNAASLVPLARASGALLVGNGPLPGSLVVLGDRARLLRRVRAWNVILLSAPAAGCGDDRRFGTPA